MTAKKFDSVVVGGGLVGNTFAYLLAQSGLRIAVVEARAPTTVAALQDNRSLVLSYTSYLILNAIGLWPALRAHAFPIHKIHVSDRGHFGAARFDAKALRLPALGYIVPAAMLNSALQQAALAQQNVTLFAPATVVAVECQGSRSQVSLKINDERVVLETGLVVAADGANSQLRKLHRIETTTYDYGQTAIIARVDLARAHDNIGYERLTETGPLALLPREEKCCGVVWTVKSKNLKDFMALSDAEFLDQLQQRFGYRLGKFIGVSPRDCYPLKLVKAKEQVRPGFVLLGNAAHTLHPLAGQGFNLALRDVAALVEVLLAANAQGKALGEFSSLQEYQCWRAVDQERIIRFTDGTVRLFANTLFPLPMARRIGLVALDLFPGIKQKLLRGLLGLGGRIPELAAGIPIGKTWHE